MTSMMKIGQWISRAGYLAAALAVSAATAEEGAWKLKLGASYRAFDDFEFGAADLPGSTTAADPAGPFGIQDLTPAQPGFVAPSLVTVDVVSYAGADVETESSSGFAPYIGGEYVLQEEDNIAWSLAFGFQYFTPDGDASANTVGLTSTPTTYDVLLDGGVPTIIPPASFVGAAGASAVTVTQEWEVDLAVLDLGVKGNYDAGGFSFGLEAGPTLNFIDVETSQSFDTSAATVIPGAATAGTAMPQASDDDSDVSLGLYIGLSVGFDISDTVGVGLGYRYDWVDQDAETAHGSLDLSSHSFMLSVELGF
jgi:hypothetical protein